VLPGSICILRLSALGDVVHAVALAQSLREQLPHARLTWIVGKVEAKLVGDLPGIEFLVLDKAAGWSGIAQLRRALARRRFDVLLHCQVSLRANLVAALVRARRRIGFDRSRAKDLHGLLLDERIPAAPAQHVQDALLSFQVPLGLVAGPPRWDIPIAQADHEVAASLLPGDLPTLIISPCSSHALRNWRAERYAAVADHAVARLGWRVAICGGRSRIERETADAILQASREPLLDLVGKDTLKQFLALCLRARAVLTPDSGPMHMANAMGVPVIGLHAASNPARSGAYGSRTFAIDCYDEAARRYRGVPASALRWGSKLEYPGVMDLVEVQAVVDVLSRIAAQPASVAR